MKKLLAVLLAFSLLGGATVLAADDEQALPEDVFVLGEASESGDRPVIDLSGAVAEEPSAGGSFMLRSAARSVLPALYDPRSSNPGILPPVRDQGTWNTCWLMAVAAAAEIGGLQKGLLTGSAGAINLSERHLVYFLSHQTDDPLGNSSGDYNTNMSSWINAGGNPVAASMTLASWHGVADEAATESPYSGLSQTDYLSSAYAYADALHLANTYAFSVGTRAGQNALKQMILNHGAAVMCMYYSRVYLFAGSPSEQQLPDEGDDDPETDPPAQTAAPEATAAPETTEPPENTEKPDSTEKPESTENPDNTENTGSSENAENPNTPTVTEPPAPLPSTGTGTNQPEEPTPVSPEQNTAAEGLIAQDGAAEADDEPVSTEDDPASADGVADDFTVCYYMDTIALSIKGTPTTNHEVAVVGWDDTYPKENFGHSSGGAIPDGDGAWLCRNSYGDTWPYGNGDGYFWISYYDKNITYNDASIAGRVTVFDFVSADDYDNNYEYDGAAYQGNIGEVNGVNYSFTTTDDSKTRLYANVFTAGAGGRELLQAVSTFTYRPGVPYTVEIYTGLADGDAPNTGTPAAAASGIFEYAGFHTVELPEAVTLPGGERFSVVFRVGTSTAADGVLYLYTPCCRTNTTSWYSVNDVQAGQSFISVDGSAWTDCFDLSNPCNVRVKAYTTNLPPETGDVDNSGSVDELDAALILQYSVEALESLPYMSVADVDESDAIDSADAAAILASLRENK